MTKLIKAAIQHLKMSFQNLDECRFFVTHVGRRAFRRAFHELEVFWVGFEGMIEVVVFSWFDSRISVAIVSMIVE